MDDHLSDPTPDEYRKLHDIKADLYKGMKSRVSDIREFMDIMDCLYALNKIELKGEVAHMLVEVQCDIFIS